MIIGTLRQRTKRADEIGLLIRANLETTAAGRLECHFTTGCNFKMPRENLAGQFKSG